MGFFYALTLRSINVKVKTCCIRKKPRPILAMDLRKDN